MAQEANIELILANLIVEKEVRDRRISIYSRFFVHEISVLWAFSDRGYAHPQPLLYEALSHAQLV